MEGPEGPIKHHDAIPIEPQRDGFKGRSGTLSGTGINWVSLSPTNSLRSFRLASSLSKSTSGGTNESPGKGEGHP